MVTGMEIPEAQKKIKEKLLIILFLRHRASMRASLDNDIKYEQINLVSHTLTQAYENEN